MAAASRLPLLLGADGLPQQRQSTDVEPPPRLTVAALNALTSIPVDSYAFAINGRAITGVGTLNSGFTTEAAGTGSGCLVTCATSSSTASTWRIAGTTAALAA